MSYSMVHVKDIEGSDLHLSSNEKPFVRVHGIMKKLEQYEVSEPAQLKKILWDIVPQDDGTLLRVLNEEYAQEVVRSQALLARCGWG